MLVNRRFRHALLNEPALWRSLQLNFQMIAGDLTPPSAESDERILGLLPLLQHFSGMLEQLSIGCRSDSLMAAVLALLQPTRMVALQLACKATWGDTLQALPCLTSITRLGLHCGQLPSCTAAVLGSLPRLGSLTVRSFTDEDEDAAPGVLAPALPRLARRLTHLDLRFYELPHAVAFSIAALSQLGSLRLEVPRFTTQLASSLSRLALAERAHLPASASSCVSMQTAQAHLPPPASWSRCWRAGTCRSCAACSSPPVPSCPPCWVPLPSRPS